MTSICPIAASIVDKEGHSVEKDSERFGWPSDDPVVLHFLKVREEPLHFGKERRELRTPATALLVPFDGVPLDAHDEVIGLLDALRHLVA